MSRTTDHIIDTMNAELDKPRQSVRIISPQAPAAFKTIVLNTSTWKTIPFVTDIVVRYPIDDLIVADITTQVRDDKGEIILTADRQNVVTVTTTYNVESIEADAQ